MTEDEIKRDDIEVENDVNDDDVVPDGPLTGAWVMRRLVADDEEPLVAYVAYHFEAPEAVGGPYLHVAFEDRFPGAFWDVADVIVVEQPGTRPFVPRYPPEEVRRLRGLLRPEGFARHVLGPAYDEPDPEA